MRTTIMTLALGVGSLAASTQRPASHANSTPETAAAPARAVSTDGDSHLVRANSLSLEGAGMVLRRAADDARRRGATPSIAVVDHAGFLLCFERMDGSFPAGAEVSIGKARTAAIFKKATAAFEDSINQGRFALLDATNFTPLRGGVPVIIDGQVVGAVGVSGAVSAAQDEEIATAGAAAFSAATAVPPLPGK
jgi:glc operon protein GlcG